MLYKRTDRGHAVQQTTRRISCDGDCDCDCDRDRDRDRDITGQEDLAQFLAAHCVRVVASLPCYGEKNVDAQRGAGVFDRSIQALQVCSCAVSADLLP